MFIIKSDSKGFPFVGDYCEEYVLVEVTNDIRYAKKFKTEKAAQKFANTYSGGGYGFPDIYAIEAI